MTDQALALLRSASTENGIMASTILADNYRRVWARDSMIAGIAGLLAEDEVVIEGMKASIETLFQNISPLGIVPSNVDPATSNVSYGSLAGRVDATTWFLVGSGLYLNHSHDQALLQKLTPKVSSIFNLLESWEFNHRHLMYTPLSGNWADEYPLHGYLLYDNLLRYWALKIWAQLLDDHNLRLKRDQVFHAISINFWPKEEWITQSYHPKIYSHAAGLQLGFGFAGFNPGGYYTMFDAAANGLAMMLGFVKNGTLNQLLSYVNALFDDLGHTLVPAFWPPIEKHDHLWKELEKNHAYAFKNLPHHFHNGGIWPVMMGVFCLGLTLQLQRKLVDTISIEYATLLEQEQFGFSEYIASDSFKIGGKKQLCFSAAGTIFMTTFDTVRISQKMML